jgi:hypothetical protein
MALFLSERYDLDDRRYDIDDFSEDLASAAKMPAPDKYHHIANLMSKMNGEVAYIESFIKRIFNERNSNQVIDGYGDTSLLLGGTNDFSFRMVKWLPDKQVPLPGLEREALVYDLVHNHDFHLLTKGIHGDGYETDIYRFDASRILGAHDEEVPMALQGRFKLTLGSVLWYEQYNDIHTQLAPQRFSMSFNVIPKDRALKYGQFIFDRSTKRIKEFTRNGSSRTLSLLTLLCDFDLGDGTKDIVTDLGRSTSNVWLKLAIAALISERWSIERAAVWDELEIPEGYAHALTLPNDRFSVRRIR